MNFQDNPLWMTVFVNAVESLYSNIESKGNAVVLVLANDTTIENYIEKFGKAFDFECHHDIRRLGYRGILWGATLKVEDTLKNGVVIVIGDKGDSLSLNLEELPYNLNIELV